MDVKARIRRHPFRIAFGVLGVMVTTLMVTESLWALVSEKPLIPTARDWVKRLVESGDVTLPALGILQAIQLAILVSGLLFLAYIAYLVRTDPARRKTVESLTDPKKVQPRAAIPAFVQPIPSITWDVRIEGNDVFVAITNDDTPRTLSAKIEAIEGGTEAVATPWAIPWRDHSSEQRLLSAGEPHLLRLVNINPRGNAKEISESGAFPKGTSEVVKFLRIWKPVLFKFPGISSEHPTYLKDQGDADGWTSILSDWSGRRLRAVVRVRSNDGEVNEARTAILGITPDPAQTGSSAIWKARPFAELQPTALALHIEIESPSEAD